MHRLRLLLTLLLFGVWLLISGCMLGKPTVAVDAGRSSVDLAEMNQHLQGRLATIVLLDGSQHLGRDAVVSADSVLWNDYHTHALHRATTLSVLMIETTGFKRPLFSRRAFWLGLVGTIGLVQLRAAIAGEHGGDNGVDPVDISLTLAGGTMVGIGTAYVWERIDSDGTIGRFVLQPASGR